MAPTERPVVQVSAVKPSGDATKNKETPSLLKRTKEKVEEVATGETREETFDNAMLGAAWQQFSEERINSGAGDAEKLVLSRELVKGDQSEAVIMLGSQLEISILEKMEQDMVTFLRAKLRNDLITIKKKVAEQEDNKKLYTSKDKFDFMLKQNPHLQALKDKLGLDFEY